MNKLFLITALFITPAIFSAPYKYETSEELLGVASPAYAHAKKNIKTAKDDHLIREYVSVIEKGYKQTWWDHHPLTTTLLQIGAVIGFAIVLQIIKNALNNPDEFRRNRGNDGGGAAARQPEQDQWQDLHPEQPHIGRNPALNGDQRYANLNPRAEGQPGNANNVIVVPLDPPAYEAPAA